MLDYAEIASEVAAALVETGTAVTFVRRSKGTVSNVLKPWRGDNASTPGEITTSVLAVRDDSELNMLASGIMQGARKYIVAGKGIDVVYRDVLEDFDVILDEGEEWKVIGVPQHIRQGGVMLAYIFSAEKIGRKGYTP